MPYPADLPARAACIAAVAFFVLAMATPAVAQVYKCVDKSGHTTYQQAPCAGGQQGGAVELKDAVTLQPMAPEVLWSFAAREGRVVAGMPKTFVTEALGKPSGIRAPRTGEVGGEVWVYDKPGQTTRVGFQDNVVAWVRSDSTQPQPGAPGAAPASDRATRVREALTIGKTCTAALQEAGAPDREEPLDAVATTGTRYVYSFDAGNPQAYAAFVCINGRVTSVERFIKGG